MYSKNNHHRPKDKREYFDRPVNYVHKGFLFSPKHKLPLELYDNAGSHYNVRIAQGPSRNLSPSPSNFGSTSFGGQSFMKKDPSKTLTTGMTDAWLFDQDFVKPKQLTKVGGQLANDYGQIPKLREPFKPNRKN